MGGDCDEARFTDQDLRRSSLKAVKFTFQLFGASIVNARDELRPVFGNLQGKLVDISSGRHRNDTNVAKMIDNF
jgi:hypothetical protein